MKIRIFFITVMFLTSAIAIAQQDTLPKISKIKYGVNVGWIVDSRALSRGSYVHFTMEKGQSFFSIGPTFGNNKDLKATYHDWYYYNKSHYNNKTYSLNGFRAVYQVTPNPARKVFQSYIHNEFIFHYYSDKGTTQQVYNDLIWGGYLPTATSYRHHQTIIGDYLGWGCKVKLPYHFYVNQSVAIGISRFTTTQTYDISSYNRKYSYYNYNVLLKIGVGHTFDYKLKPIKLKRQPLQKDLDALIANDIAKIDAPKKQPTIKLPKKVKEKQPKSKPVWGCNVGVFYVPDKFFNYYTQLTLNQGKNYFALGPVFGNYSVGIEGYVYNNYVEKVPVLTGFNAVYERTLFPKRQVDMGFHYDFMYQMFSGSGNNYNNPYNAQIKYVNNYIGWTFKEYLNGNVYLNQVVGLGALYHQWNTDYSNNSSRNDKGSMLEPGLLLKFGIGYKFASKPVFELPPEHRYKKDSIPNKAVWGINIGSALYTYTNNLPAYANITLEKGKNAFELGILTSKIDFYGGHYYDYYYYGSVTPPSNKYTITGVNIVYQRFPKLYKKRHKFYFQNLLTATHVSFNGTRNIVQSYIPMVIKSSNYNAQETIVMDYIGYGCKVNLFNNFYLDQCIGIGMGYGSSKISYDGYSDNIGHYTHGSFLLKLGIGYRFEKKMKKI